MPICNYGKYFKPLLVVDYELLATNATQSYPHHLPVYRRDDYDNVQYDADEFDSHLGVQGLHRVCGKVSFETRRLVLPQDLFDNYSQMSFWQDALGSAAHQVALVPQKNTTAST